jgi:ribonuclease HI
MEKIIIYTDGASRGNPGPAAIGVFIADSTGTMITEVAETIGNASDNFAEYQAVLRGLQIVQETYGEKTHEMEFEVRLDSELAQKQLNGESEIKEAGLVPYFIEIHNLRVSTFPRVVFTLIQSELNADAKRLVKEALDA